MYISEVTQTWTACGCGDKYAPLEEAPFNLATSYISPAGLVHFDERNLTALVPQYDSWGHTFDQLYFEISIYKEVTWTEYSTQGGSGVRLYKITNNDGQKNETKTYRYKHPENPMKSSGVIGSFPVYSFDATELMYPKTGCSPIILKQGTGIIDMGCTQGSHIGYSCVSEFINDTIRTDFYYTTFADYMDLSEYDENNLCYPSEFSPNIQRLSEREAYKKRLVCIEKMMQSTVYDYTYRFLDSRRKWAAHIITTPGSQIKQGFYYRGWLFSEYLELSNVIQTDYDLTQEDLVPLISVNTSFSYTPFFNLRSKTLVNSDGKTGVTEYTYPYDYPGNSLFQSWMDDSHIYNTVISENRYVESQLSEKREMNTPLIILTIQYMKEFSIAIQQ